MEHILRGQTSLANEDEALAEIARLLNGNNTDYVFLFISTAYDLKNIESLIPQYFNGKVFGCTTAGEIGTCGITKHGISGFSIRSKAMTFESVLIENISSETITSLEYKYGSQLSNLSLRNGSKNFNILFCDGMSLAEENICSLLSNYNLSLPLAGGSAGNHSGLMNTAIIHEGIFISNAAILLSAQTNNPFYIFRSHHFTPMEQKLIVTKSDIATRTVYEINGKSALKEYSAALEIQSSEINSKIILDAPLMYSLDEMHFLQAVKEIKPDGSLNFFSGISEGTVLKLGRKTDFIRELNETIETIKSCVKEIELIICFECVLRRIEMLNKKIEDEVGSIYSKNKAVGFHTFGEQYLGRHINQTLCGIALGKPLQ